MRFWLAILLLAGLTACAADNNDPRYQFGVSADRPLAATPADSQAAGSLLAWKAAQLCTQGYRLVRQDTMNAENGSQIVDNHVQCNGYRPSIDPTSLSATDFSLDLF